jgi:hypothetical protein
MKKARQICLTYRTDHLAFRTELPPCCDSAGLWTAIPNMGSITPTASRIFGQHRPAHDCCDCRKKG